MAGEGVAWLECKFLNLECGFWASWHLELCSQAAWHSKNSVLGKLAAKGLNTLISSYSYNFR